MDENWTGLYGHFHNREVIERILTTSKLPHSFLFVGKSGIGKDFFAIRMAQLINEKFATDSDRNKIISGIEHLNEPYIKYIFALPRGKNETDDSTPLEKLTAEDLEEIRMRLEEKIKNPYYEIKIPKANAIKINSIRDIIKFISFEFGLSFYRFILISNAHMMNEPAQNSLLKNLEEPPEKVIFILTTPYPELLRETIRSRCWYMYFSPLSVSDVSQILIKYFNIEKRLADEVAVFADGSITIANQLLEHNFKALKDKTISFLRYSLGKKFHQAYTEISSLLVKDESYRLKLFVQMVITWLNDVQRYRVSPKNFYFKDYQETLEKFNKKFPKSNLHNTASKLDYLGSLIENNINLNLLAMNMIYSISGLTK